MGLPALPVAAIAAHTVLGHLRKDAIQVFRIWQKPVGVPPSKDRNRRRSHGRCNVNGRSVIADHESGAADHDCEFLQSGTPGQIARSAAGQCSDPATQRILSPGTT